MLETTELTVPLEILLVEDDPGDIILMREALDSATVSNSVTEVHDGEEAMSYLSREGHFADATRPDIVLLDLNMPRVDGREVLAWIKSHPTLHRTPVIVFTTSSAEEDVVESYDLHANAYVTKPLDFDRFQEVVRSIDEFFGTTARLPG